MITSLTLTPTPILVFDLMDTVVIDPFFTELPRRFGARLQLLRAARDPDIWPAFERGEIDEASFLARLYRTPHPDLPSPHELRDAIVARYRYVPGIPELLSRLRASGHHLWALSNYPVWIDHVRHQLDLDAVFDGLIVSCEIGARKPDPAAFQRAAERIGEPRRSLLLVDDRAVNCDAAQQQGWRAIHFSSAARLEIDLKAYGVL